MHAPRSRKRRGFRRRPFSYRAASGALAQRKDNQEDRLSGLFLFRFAARWFLVLSLFHEPPR